METLAAGQVVSVDFPFSDVEMSKVRPAVILAPALHGDYLMAPITSNPYADSDAASINDDAFASGGLWRPSFLRPAKLYTAHLSLVENLIGTLHAEMHQAIVERIIEVLRRELRYSK